MSLLLGAFRNDESLVSVGSIHGLIGDFKLRSLSPRVLQFLSGQQNVYHTTSCRLKEIKFEIKGISTCYILIGLKPLGRIGPIKLTTLKIFPYKTSRLMLFTKLGRETPKQNSAKKKNKSDP